MNTRDLGRVYVTGACGFIGSHLVETLIKEGHEVTALCLYNSFGSYGWLEEAARKKHSHLKIILGDVRDGQFMAETIKDHQTVFHLSSLIAIPYSYQAPQSYFDTNVYGALHVAQACLQAKVERMIHTSTSEVYGTAQIVPIPETHPLQGQSPYSASKISADVLVESFHRSFDLPVVTLRPFNTYGPRQSMRAVIPTIIAQLLAGERGIKLGNTTPTRDFNFVKDTVNAFISVAKCKKNILGEVFNAGSGREISVGDTVKMIADLLQAKVIINSDDIRKRPNLSEVERLLCNSKKLQETTGWSPQTSLEAGLSETIEWMKGVKGSFRPHDYHV